MEREREKKIRWFSKYILAYVCVSPILLTEQIWCEQTENVFCVIFQGPFFISLNDSKSKEGKNRNIYLFFFLFLGEEAPLFSPIDFCLISIQIHILSSVCVCVLIINITFARMANTKEFVF